MNEVMTYDELQEEIAKAKARHKAPKITTVSETPAAIPQTTSSTDRYAGTSGPADYYHQQVTQQNTAKQTAARAEREVMTYDELQEEIAKAQARHEPPTPTVQPAAQPGIPLLDPSQETTANAFQYLAQQLQQKADLPDGTAWPSTRPEREAMANQTTPTQRRDAIPIRIEDLPQTQTYLEDIEAKKQAVDYMRDQLGRRGILGYPEADPDNYDLYKRLVTKYEEAQQRFDQYIFEEQKKIAELNRGLAVTEAMESEEYKRDLQHKLLVKALGEGSEAIGKVFSFFANTKNAVNKEIAAVPFLYIENQMQTAENIKNSNDERVALADTVTALQRNVGQNHAVSIDMPEYDTYMAMVESCYEELNRLKKDPVNGTPEAIAQAKLAYEMAKDVMAERIVDWQESQKDRRTAEEAAALAALSAAELPLSQDSLGVRLRDSAELNKDTATEQLPAWAQPFYRPAYDFAANIPAAVLQKTPNPIANSIGTAMDAVDSGADAIYEGAKAGISANEAGLNVWSAVAKDQAIDYAINEIPKNGKKIVKKAKEVYQKHFA